MLELAIIAAAVALKRERGGETLDTERREER
jgi:hypothetical protein